MRLLNKSLQQVEGSRMVLTPLWLPIVKVRIGCTEAEAAGGTTVGTTSQRVQRGCRTRMRESSAGFSRPMLACFSGIFGIIESGGRETCVSSSSSFLSSWLPGDSAETPAAGAGVADSTAESADLANPASNGRALESEGRCC